MFTVTSHEIHWAIVVNHNLGKNMAQNQSYKKFKQLNHHDMDMFKEKKSGRNIRNHV